MQHSDLQQTGKNIDCLLWRSSSRPSYSDSTHARLTAHPRLQLGDHPLALALRELLGLLQAHRDLADLHLQLLPQRLRVAVVLLLAAQLVVQSRVLRAQSVGAVLGRAARVQRFVQVRLQRAMTSRVEYIAIRV